MGPQHIALEVGPAEFKRLFSQAQKMGLEPRAELRADAPADAGVLHMSGKAYRHFYVLDPSRVSVEILTPLSLGI